MKHLNYCLVPTEVLGKFLLLFLPPTMMMLLLPLLSSPNLVSVPSSMYGGWEVSFEHVSLL